MISDQRSLAMSTLLRAYELTKGSTISNQWKLYNLDKIKAPKSLDGPFSIRDDYKKSDSAMKKTILLQL